MILASLIKTHSLQWRRCRRKEQQENIRAMWASRIHGKIPLVQQRNQLQQFPQWLLMFQQYSIFLQGNSEQLLTYHAKLMFWSYQVLSWTSKIKPNSLYITELVVPRKTPESCRGSPGNRKKKNLTKPERKMTCILTFASFVTWAWRFTRKPEWLKDFSPTEKS